MKGRQIQKILFIKNTPDCSQKSGLILIKQIDFVLTLTFSSGMLFFDNHNPIHSSL